MCGIVGYVGNKQTIPLLFDGMRRLEYRGYDSSGITYIDAQGILATHKVVGGVDALAQSVGPHTQTPSTIGIGHLRWASHGGVTIQNAHPHLDCVGTSAIAHNGIIENHRELKQELSARHTFRSDTDTEVIAHLFEELFAVHKALLPATVALVTRLQGAFACVIACAQLPDTLLVIRNKSPLCIGIGEDAHFVASDPQAFAHHTHQVLFLEDKSFAIISKDTCSVFSFAGNNIQPVIQRINMHEHAHGKGEYAHYMLKEIYEQKRVVHDTVKFFRELSDEQLLERCNLTLNQLQELEELVLIGCGTSAHAAEIAKFLFESIAHIPTRTALASEYRYHTYFPNAKRLSCMISQSGETADTLEVLRLCLDYNENVIACTNISTSTMAREARGCIPMQAQREISVASTKCFTAQLATLACLAYRFAALKQKISYDQLLSAYEQLLSAAQIMHTTAEQYEQQIQELYAPIIAQWTRSIFIGKGVSYSFAKEAALKLKEIAYIFVDTYPAGELKHGPLALIDETVPVVVFSVLDDLIYSKLVANVQEARARKAPVFVFAFEGQDELIQLTDHAIIIPRVEHNFAPLVMTMVMQLVMYYTAVALGRPIDKPRNLAKSLTIE